jgi:hypothetical protein
MANFVYLIGTAYLKENTPLNDNLDDKLLKNAIKEAQEIYIRDIIGSGLYNEIQTQAFNSTLTNLNQTLIDNYIAPCLKYYTLVESMLPLTFKFLNKSVATRSAEFATPATPSDLSLIEHRYRDKAEYYAERLRDYLKENTTQYPLFQNPGSGFDVIRPSNTAFFGGMYLPGGEDECFFNYDYDK